MFFALNELGVRPQLCPNLLNYLPRCHRSVSGFSPFLCQVALDGGRPWRANGRVHKSRLRVYLHARSSSKARAEALKIEFTQESALNQLLQDFSSASNASSSLSYWDVRSVMQPCTAIGNPASEMLRKTCAHA